jgi:hypothetical protein
MKKQYSARAAKRDNETSPISLKRGTYSADNADSEQEEMPRRSIDDSEYLVKSVY